MTPPFGGDGPPVRMIDEQFRFSRVHVCVAAIGDSGEALLIRGLLESLGASVSLHWVGVPQDLLLVLNDPAPPGRYLILSGHGDASGIVFGEYSEDIDTSLLSDGRLPAAALCGKIRLPGRIVISTACETGSPDFGRALAGGGATAYIAPTGLPDGADAVLFVHRLFHLILTRGLPIDEALRHARAYDEESPMFVGYGEAV
ncbi:CHAT domain-containing protein [Burkholderia multivorans]|uniref:CHAT domain-containing protein n=1 Tax=Burkholderia multivorans TaxID=87883 RepID=UPI002158DBC5|nr:CHAT domain-containing protein [Burkholderia multivorans]MDN8048220.1 CHAT domain-containing protein [Burkholderia multivorans]